MNRVLEQRSIAVLIIAGLAIVAFSVDVPLAVWFVRDRGIRFLHRHLQSAEPFGEAAGIILVAMILVTFDPENRRRVARFLAACCGTGLAAGSCKLFVSRIRPYVLDLESPPTVWETFSGSFPFFTVTSKFQSFPSAHTATAIAAATILSHWYPRGARLFWTVGILVGLQRAETGAHYLSDCLVGGLIGYTGTLLLLPKGLWAKPFDQFESQPIQETLTLSRAA